MQIALSPPLCHIIIMIPCHKFQRSCHKYNPLNASRYKDDAEMQNEYNDMSEVFTSSHHPSSQHGLKFFMDAPHRLKLPSGSHRGMRGEGGLGVISVVVSCCVRDAGWRIITKNQ